MIKYNPKEWWGLIFQFHKSDTFRRLLPAMLSLALFSAAVAYFEHIVNPWEHGTTLLHTLLGLVISLLLVFRTNTAYERWWEGRKLWGALVNVSRNMAIKLHAWLPDEDTKRREMFSELIARFPRVLKEHLRDNKVPGATPDGIQHQPNWISAQMHRRVQEMMDKGEISGEQYLAINQELSAWADILGACERIKKTPIPYSYSLFLKKFIFVYIVTMPFTFAFEFGYWTTLIATLMFYVLGSLEMIAEEIEDPFGTDANDLPTDGISEGIATSVAEILHPPLAQEEYDENTLAATA
ncbi:MAG: bestrophin family ion channel [Bacteroidota bacterium]